MKETINRTKHVRSGPVRVNTNQKVISNIADVLLEAYLLVSWW